MLYVAPLVKLSNFQCFQLNEKPEIDKSLLEKNKTFFYSSHSVIGVVSPYLDPQLHRSYQI